jgi:hypothetical protein
MGASLHLHPVARTRPRRRESQCFEGRSLSDPIPLKRSPQCAFVLLGSEFGASCFRVREFSWLARA